MAREPEIAFACPHCGREAVTGGDGRGRCTGCARDVSLVLAEELGRSRVVETCPACGGAQLYVQRDFNQKAGLAIVIVGAALAPFTPYYASLFAAVAVDALLYTLLPEITICYRCHAHFRGFARNPRHQGFDLHIAEQYDARGGSGGDEEPGRLGPAVPPDRSPGHAVATAGDRLDGRTES